MYSFFFFFWWFCLYSDAVWEKRKQSVCVGGVESVKTYIRARTRTRVIRCAIALNVRALSTRPNLLCGTEVMADIYWMTVFKFVLKWLIVISNYQNPTSLNIQTGNGRTTSPSMWAKSIVSITTLSITHNA